MKKIIVKKKKKSQPLTEQTSAMNTHLDGALENKETVETVSTLSKHDASKIPTSIIISGVESDRYWGIVVDQCGMKTVLMSYHYLQTKPKDFLKKRMDKYPDVKVFIDSGAFTLMVNRAKETADWTDATWEVYLKNYAEFIEYNRDFIFACANLDVEKVVGAEKVDEWNEKYFHPLEDSGVDVCYIWHPERGKGSWEDYCKRHSYVGMSMETDEAGTVQAVTKFINVAKKHGTRVHGMAMTKTEILTRLPFFSCDSTTWLVGQQYGELNWFDGRGMRRLSKHDWQTTYKTRLLREPFNADWEKLMHGMGGRGDTYELLRLNVLAYKFAEEHVRKRLRNRMYWLKENGTGETEDFKNSIDDVEIPTLEWFDGDNEDYKYYMNSLHLDPEMDREEAIDLLYSFYLYINDDGTKLADVSDEDLIDYCNNVLEVKVDTREQAIAEAKRIYTANALGERHDFVMTEAEEEMSRAKERPVYMDDSQYMFVDLTKEELKMYLPPSPDEEMPEVDEYDAELRKNDIVPVRDDKGRFIKGQKKIRKPKNMYSELMPKLNCDTCYKSGDCPEYKAGYVCAYNKVFKRFDTRNLEDVLDAMQSMVGVNLERMQRQMMFEVMDGGMATPEVSGLIDQNMRLLQQIKELSMSRIAIQQKKVIREDGTEETVTTASVNPQGQGILSRIFGASDDKEKRPRKNIVEVDYSED